MLLDHFFSRVNVLDGLEGCESPFSKTPGHYNGHYQESSPRAEGKSRQVSNTQRCRGRISAVICDLFCELSLLPRERSFSAKAIVLYSVRVGLVVDLRRIVKNRSLSNSLLLTYPGKGRGAQRTSRCGCFLRLGTEHRFWNLGRTHLYLLCLSRFEIIPCCRDKGQGRAYAVVYLLDVLWFRLGGGRQAVL